MMILRLSEKQTINYKNTNYKRRDNKSSKGLTDILDDTNSWEVISLIGRYCSERKIYNYFCKSRNV